MNKFLIDKLHVRMCDSLLRIELRPSCWWWCRITKQTRTYHNSECIQSSSTIRVRQIQKTEFPLTCFRDLPIFQRRISLITEDQFPPNLSLVVIMTYQHLLGYADRRRFHIFLTSLIFNVSTLNGRKGEENRRNTGLMTGGTPKYHKINTQ